MNNERFTIAESLFNPSCLGIDQGGIIDAIEESMQLLDEDMRPVQTANIFVTGGNACMQNFTTRIEKEVKSRFPTWYKVNALQLDKYASLLIYLTKI
jgi:actin-related protein 6